MNYLDDNIHRGGESREVTYTCPLCGLEMVASDKPSMSAGIAIHDQIAHAFDGGFEIEP